MPGSELNYRDRKIEKEHLHVTCAIIERNGQVLAAQRSAAMSLPLKWEFPGGKIQAGESPEECLRREIHEELGITIAITKTMKPATHSYPGMTVTLYPFVCVVSGEKLIRNEHNALIWLPPAELPALDWAAADLPVLAAYLRQLEKAG